MADRFEVLVTAEEAWPAFERAVLRAKREIIASFRVFDLMTPVISDEARAVGRDWFDLFLHVLGRGISVQLTISDFDPIMATDQHAATWRTVRQGVALAEVSGAGPDQLRVTAALHPAKVGMLPKAFFLAPVLRKRRDEVQQRTAAQKEREALGLRPAGLPDLHPVSHHQKLAVIDGETLYVGGLDLSPRRWDTRTHDAPAPETWSDVQAILSGGPEVVEAHAHLRSFVEACMGKRRPSPATQLKRTLSVSRRFQMPFLSPRTRLAEIEKAHVLGFRQAEHLVYIETQFLRSSVIADALAEAARDNEDLGAVVILPGLPEGVAFDGAQGLDARFGLSRRRNAVEGLTRAFGARLTLASPVRPVMAARETSATLAGSPLVYVHNKVLVIDDRCLMIGSANLNGRSMKWDTEVAVETRKPAQVADGRRKLLSHWWFHPLPDEALDPRTLQSWWARSIAQHGVMRPEQRSGFLVPFDPMGKSELEQSLPGVTENIV